MGYVYKGTRPEAPKFDISKYGPPAASCGTEAAWKRHRRAKFECDYCEDAHARFLVEKAEAREVKRKAIRDARNAKRVDPLPGARGPNGVLLKPCGTVAARARHYKYDEEIDEACAEAYRVHSAEKRRAERLRARKRREAAREAEQLEKEQREQVPQDR